MRGQRASQQHFSAGWRCIEMIFTKLGRGMSLQRLSLFFTLFFIIAILTLAVLSYTQIVQEQKAEEKADNAYFQYQIERLSDVLGYINAFLFDTLTNSSYAETAETAKDTLEHNHALRQIQSALDYENTMFNSDFSYMFYVLSDTSVVSRAATIGYDEDEKIRAIIIGRIDNGEYEKIRQNWYCENLDGSWYIYQVFKAGNSYISAWIRCDEAFDFFLKNSAYRDAEIDYLSPGADIETAGKKVFVFNPELIETELAFRFTDETSFSAVKSILILFLLTLLLDIIFYAYVMSYYSQNISKPLKALRNGISAIESLPAGESGARSELDEANLALSTLKTQLENIEVRYYKSQVDLVKTELDYFMLQIKPHFFINCLSIIHSMIQKKSYTEAQDFCVYLSRYIRYMFFESLQCVPLNDEVEHLNLYLRIQNIRSHTDLFIDENISPDAVDAVVPPLLLVTFVENSVKHSSQRPEDLLISLSVNRIRKNGKDWLSIMICDNGVGFPESYISAFNSGEIHSTVTERGVQNIGIQNIRKRMSLLYGNSCSITLMNNHGANILIEIPFAPEKRDGQAEKKTAEVTP